MNRDSSQPAQKKRKLGGIQQRLAKAEAQDKENALKQRERLAFSLVTKWAWGHLSPQEVQSTAADAIADMKSFGMEQLPQWLSKFAARRAGETPELWLCAAFTALGSYARMRRYL